MGNLTSYLNGGDDHQANRYVPLLGSMLGGSFPTSVALYELVNKSSDVVKLFAFGGLTLGVFAVASGLAATSLGSTAWTKVYARFASLTAVTIALCLYTGALCSLFTTPGYQISCACVFAVLILAFDAAWILFKW